MRSFVYSVISLIAAAPMAVLGQDQTYYLKTNTNEYFSYSTVSRGVDAAFLQTYQNESYPLYIDSNSELLLEDGSDTLTVSLSTEVDGTDGLYGVLLDFGTATTGFSFASNGSLLVSQSDFNGFYACAGGVYGRQLFWSGTAISTPSGCGVITFTAVSA